MWKIIINDRIRRWRIILIKIIINDWQSFLWNTQTHTHIYIYIEKTNGRKIYTLVWMKIYCIYFADIQGILVKIILNMKIKKEYDNDRKYIKHAR